MTIKGGVYFGDIACMSHLERVEVMVGGLGSRDLGRVE